jgi:cytochrome P450
MIETLGAAEKARIDAERIPLNALQLDRINVAQASLFRDNIAGLYFERLRREAPVHFCAENRYGPYWSITKFADIMQVEMNPEVFSSKKGVTLIDQEEDFQLPMFIAMDPPKHEAQRKVVSPIVSAANLAAMESVIRERAAKILDELPIGETFDWVDRVSVELTSQMLATLLGFPFDERRKLTRWSDVATADIESDIIASKEARREELLECLHYFLALWNERVNSEPRGDLISMLAHAEATRNMQPMEYLGNILLLIVGGNDTTRNSISGGVLALNKYPAEYQKLRENPGLVPNMIPEIIRWQTPISHMRRTATADFELGGKQIKAGDKVLLWYISGNRDDEAIDNPEAFIIDRERPRHHLSFGFGIHRCMGNRLAEMQLRVVWEEIMKRWKHVEVMEEPRRVLSTFINGYETMPVRIHA